MSLDSLCGVRMTGVIDDARGFGLHDHVCWVYEDPEDFRSRAREFLAEGLGQVQRVWYVALGEVEGLVEDVHDIEGMDRALRDGAAQVVSLDDGFAPARWYPQPPAAP